ncbi:MAG: [Fe-Fe] hydrogenase large subunit C-terminal domain-containing protein [Candidatus Micrarchaeaceae archaeon]
MAELIETIEKEKGLGKIIAAEIAPAVRVSIGEAFGVKGSNLIGKIVTFLKGIGVDYVVDTPIGADIITYCEAMEINDAINAKRSIFPIFNSCCSGWRLYAKKMHPELLPYISKFISPQMAAGMAAKHEIALRLSKSFDDIYMISIMPCTSKRIEEKKASNGHTYIDRVFTCIELEECIREKGVDFLGLKEESMSDILSECSSTGLNFGSSGGVMNAVLQSLAKVRKEELKIEYSREDFITKGRAKIGEIELEVAIVYGFDNFEEFYKGIKNGARYDIIEVMMCNHGCIGGPSQPPANGDILEIRANALQKSAMEKQRKTAVDSNIRQIILPMYSSEEFKGMFYFTDETFA